MSAPQPAGQLQYTYPMSEHERTINEIFGDGVNVAPQPRQYPCVIIAFVNRSGSNYLAELLKSTGKFAGLGESLNAHTVKYLAPRYRAVTFADYLIRLRQEDLRGSDKVWGLKTGWMQFSMLCRSRAIPNLLRPQIILIRRRDIVAQAISYYIAEQTAQWTSKESATIDRDKITYDGAKIMKHLVSIVDSNSKLQTVLTLSGCPFEEIVYEDLIQDPDRVLLSVTEKLIGSKCRAEHSAVPIKIQRDSTSEFFIEAFRTELNNLIWTAQL